MPFIKNASLVLNAIDLWTQHHAMILLMAKYFAGKNYDSGIQIVYKIIKLIKEIKVYEIQVI